MKKGTKIAVSIFIGILILLFVAVMYLFTTSNPRVRLLMAVFHTTESTLEDPGYLLYDIDIMDLCRNYMNADTEITGVTGFQKIEKVKSSINMEMVSKRSFAQKRMATDIDMDLLWINAGKMRMYEEGETVYLEAPLLADDFGYAFPTGMNLFPKAPDLTSDIDQEWFRTHSKDIVDLMGDIRIEETSKVITDDKGEESEEFVITIPVGSGDFIWELLGMNPPKHDVVVSEYLTKRNYVSRIEMDLEKAMKGAKLVIDGENLGTSYFYYNLPENERMEMVMTRNPKYKHWMDCSMSYYTNTEDIYTMTSNMTWENLEEGFELKVNDLVISKGDNLLAEGFFKGKVVPVKDMTDVFDGRADEIHGLEVLDWRKIREDSEGFINDVLEKTSMGMFVSEK